MFPTADLTEHTELESAIDARHPVMAECGAIITHPAIVPDANYLTNFIAIDCWMMELAREMADRGNYAAQDDNVYIGVQRVDDAYYATFDQDGERVVSLVGISAEAYAAYLPPDVPSPAESVVKGAIGQIGLCSAYINHRGVAAEERKAARIRARAFAECAFLLGHINVDRMEALKALADEADDQACRAWRARLAAARRDAKR
jgi:hypothetical protein